MRSPKSVRSIPATASRRVIVALRMAGIAGQDKLNGVFEYLSEGHRWQLFIHRTKQEFTAETVREEIARGADGFIVGIPDAADALDELARTDLPVVLMNIPGDPFMRCEKAVVSVQSDARAVGREAALAFMRQGAYRSYGFIGYPNDPDWSHGRGDAFAKTLAENGLACSSFDTRHFGEKLTDRKTLHKWLAALKKPCGILTACDDSAFELLDVCNDHGLRVPGEIGILGVNNDPILCENATPKLSSVQPDFIGEGRLAAELLDRMMSGLKLPATPTPRLYSIGIRGIVNRETTVRQSGSGRLVQRALAYIEKNACKGIGVMDVARELKVSRTLLQLRFSELQHESVYEAILRVRLEEVRRRLVQTDESITAITETCGWTSPAPLKALFKKRYGISMRDWRANPTV